MVNYMNGKIYKVINNVNDDVYIGTTCIDLSMRMAYHRWEAYKFSIASPYDHPNTSLGPERLRFYRALTKIGEKAFKIVLIRTYSCESKEELVAKQRSVMEAYRKKGVVLFNDPIKVDPPEKGLKKKLCVYSINAHSKEV